jgi:hypothetical protein
MLPSANTRPNLVVIQGDGAKPSPWRDLPSTLIGRSPYFRDQLAIYRLAKNDIQKDIEAYKYQPVFNAWPLVLGQVPPIPNASKIERELSGHRLISMREAHACFRGLKRPVGEDNRGFDVYAFISKPTHYVRYEPGMACQGVIERIPDDLVFASYVRIDVGRRTSAQTDAPPRVTGVVTHWGLVEADPSDPMLPIGFKERYRKQTW